MSHEPCSRFKLQLQGLCCLLSLAVTTIAGCQTGMGYTNGGAWESPATCKNSTGCKNRRTPLGGANCDDIAAGAIPRPAGTYTCQWQSAQIARATQGKMVVFENEWYLGGQELGPEGQKHIARIAKLISANEYPVVVEPHFDTQRNAFDESLNEARRLAVVDRLTRVGVPNPESRVIVGLPEAEGLYGPEAQRYGNMRMMGGFNLLGGGGLGGGLGGGGGGLGGGGLGGGFGGGGIF
jgi:hypothetical protein